MKKEKHLVEQAYERYMKEVAPTIKTEQYLMDIKQSCKLLTELCEDITSVSMEDTNDKNNQ